MEIGVGCFEWGATGFADVIVFFKVFMGGCATEGAEHAFATFDVFFVDG